MSSIESGLVFFIDTFGVLDAVWSMLFLTLSAVFFRPTKVVVSLYYKEEEAACIKKGSLNKKPKKSKTSNFISVH